MSRMYRSYENRIKGELEQVWNRLVKMETNLKLEGKYEEYARKMVSKNIITHIEEAEQFIEEFASMGKDTYVTEQGDIEDWEGGTDKEKIVKEMKKGLQEMKEALEK